MVAGSGGALTGDVDQRGVLSKGGDLMMSWKAAAALGLLTCFGASGLKAQEFPTRPITLIVPYTAGGGNDAMARVVADTMGRRSASRS